MLDSGVTPDQLFARRAAVGIGLGLIEPVGLLAASVIVSLRRGATCAEAEKIKKPQEPGTPQSPGWFK